MSGVKCPERDQSDNSYSQKRRNPMAGTYKITEIVGTSPTSFAEAVRAAVTEAAKTVRNLEWFEVVDERGRIKDGTVVEFQVTVKIGFKLER
jgi:flavin-binding protein dodecin